MFVSRYTATLLLASPWLTAAPLPDRPGKAETAKSCGKGHTLDMATSVRRGQARWTLTISKIENLGAQDF